jgi:hypothetical protein
MLSWSESKGERARPFIPICVYHVSGGVSSLQRCEILPARLLSPRSALRVFDCSSSCGLMQLQLISLQSFLRTREENQSLLCVCVFGAPDAWTRPHARPTFAICSSSHPK